MAVLLMVFHHCFFFPCWYISTPPPAFLTDPHLLNLAEYAKICVYIFAFLTGWTYYFHKNKTIGYSCRKISTFLVSYWIAVIPIIIFAYLCCDYHYSMQTLGEFLPILRHPLMIHTWYVWFYILMMAVFPLMRLTEGTGKSILSISLFFICMSGIMVCSRQVHVFNHFYTSFPSAMAGYCFARFRLFEHCISHIHSKPIAGFMSIITLILSYYMSTILNSSAMLCHLARPLSAGLFIMGILFLLHVFRWSKLKAAFKYIGIYSMNIWFFHCIFHSSITRNFIQPVAFYFLNPIWIYSVVVLTSLLLSIMATPLQKCLVNRLLSPIFDNSGR